MAFNWSVSETLWHKRVKNKVVASQYSNIHHILTMGEFPVNPNTNSTHLSESFCPWIFSLNIGLNMLPSDSFVSCLHYLIQDILWESSKLCKWLSLRCGLTTCCLSVGPLFGDVFFAFNYAFTYLLMPQNVIIHCFYLPDCHVSHSVLFFT